MRTHRRRAFPGIDALEERLPLSTAAASADTIAILNAFSQAYPSHVGDANYNPAFDLNHNGQIGQDDGRLLMRALPPVAPKRPITLTLSLAPADQAHGSLPKNSGGITHHMHPTVVGHTTPGALIFTGAGTVDLKLRGPVLVADASGNFRGTVDLADGINQFDFQAVDRNGRQVLRAFPIFWLDFAAYGAAHPRRT